MFISQLKNKINAYDKYGIHFANGLKALYVTLLLFIFNFLYTVEHPYFYYFYVPLTAFAAELAGDTLEEKILFLFFTLMGCTLAIFLFGLFSLYLNFFIFFVFFFSVFLYSLALNKGRGTFIAVPIILSLSAYSLIYGNANSNVYIALNHALQTIVATLIIIIGLLFFPKRYYLNIWHQAFIDVVQTLETLSKNMLQTEAQPIAAYPEIVVMERYSRMLSRKMNYISVLKVNLLTFDTIMMMSYCVTFQHEFNRNVLALLHANLVELKHATHKKQPVLSKFHGQDLLDDSSALRTIHQLIHSWNTLCYDH